jgi:hypothetical protein
MHAQKGISCSSDFPSLGSFAIAASLRNSRNAVYPNGVRQYFSHRIHEAHDCQFHAQGVTSDGADLLESLNFTEQIH